MKDIRFKGIGSKALIALASSAMFVLVLFSGAFSCSAGPYRDAEAARVTAPVSVMEDTKVPKRGLMSLAVDSVEGARKSVYDIVRANDGYIFYEELRNTNDVKKDLVFRIQLYNDSFLAVFDELRKIGTIESSVVSSGLDATTSAAGADAPAPAAKARDSVFELRIGERGNMGKSFAVGFSIFGVAMTYIVPIIAIGSLFLLFFASIAVAATYASRGIRKLVGKKRETEAKGE